MESRSSCGSWKSGLSVWGSVAGAAMVLVSVLWLSSWFWRLVEGLEDLWVVFGCLSLRLVRVGQGLIGATGEEGGRGGSRGRRGRRMTVDYEEGELEGGSEEATSS